VRCPDTVTATRVLKPVHPRSRLIADPTTLFRGLPADGDERDAVADLTRSGDVGPAVPVVLIKDEVLPVAEAHGRRADHVELPIPVDVGKREVMAAGIPVDDVGRPLWRKKSPPELAGFSNQTSRLSHEAMIPGYLSPGYLKAAACS